MAAAPPPLWLLPHPPYGCCPTPLICTTNPPLQVSLMAGWQNISELFIKSGASTAGVPAIKARLTCPDCKRIVAKYNL